MDFKKHFSSATDPRVGRISHLLSDIIGLSIIAVMAGCEGYGNIHSTSVFLIEDTDELRLILPIRHCCLKLQRNVCGLVEEQCIGRETFLSYFPFSPSHYSFGLCTELGGGHHGEIKLKTII